MTAVGPYEFTLTDARKTLFHAIDVLDQYPAAAWPCQAGRRARISSVLEGLDTVHGELADLEPALEVVWPELLAGRDDLADGDLLPATALGSVVQLNLSDWGVPKRSIDRVDVDFDGVIGDRQGDRTHHGQPWQALCLWSAEIVAALADEGHPIGHGAAGENITLAGLPWASLHPGVRVRIGTALREVSSYAVPCKKNTRWFADGDVSRIHHDHGGLSRLYATVLEPGRASVGDDAVLEPA